MALPNGSVLITPGTGVEIATEQIGGIQYPAVILAGPNGHLTDSLDTFIAWANDVSFAQDKYHISILNGAGSGKLVKLHKLFAVNLQVTAITGVMVRFDIMTITAHSGGTLVTPAKLDLSSPNLASQVTARTGATAVTEDSTLFGFATTNEEVGATGTLIAGTHALQAMNLLFESSRMQEFTLREGQGLAVKQITSTIVGTFGWLIVFTVE